mmetsp:Transcript_5402/g.12268  ORF Transcript_5402/g.12268 Transcript_5402/m.12268 type:complete len:107 (+) Transcript_5402:2487-2807(+)
MQDAYPSACRKLLLRMNIANISVDATTDTKMFATQYFKGVGRRAQTAAGLYFLLHVFRHHYCECLFSNVSNRWGDSVRSERDKQHHDTMENGKGVGGWRLKIEDGR